MTVHACQAGKDVYVEKPAASILKKAAMVDAADKRNQEAALKGVIIRELLY